MNYTALTNLLNEPRLYSWVMTGIVIFTLACLWILVGVALTRSRTFGDNGTIAMIHYNFPGFGLAMLAFYVLLWPVNVIARLILEYLWAPFYFWYAGMNEKMTVNMTNDVRASLLELGVLSNARDTSDLFRKAIGTYHFVTDAKKKGMTFYAVDAQGEHHHIDFP